MDIPQPLRYILELLSVSFFYLVAFSGAAQIIGLCFLLLIFTPVWPIVVVYIAWCALFDWNTPRHGGRTEKESMIKLQLFELIRDYYPITLEKTSNLDPNKNYIFGYHPHGFTCDGAVVALQTEALGFRQKYPGITPHMTVLSGLFRSILYRDILMSLGFIDVGKESLKYALTKIGPGHSVIIAVGGAAEAIYTRKDCYYLTLKRRKGFVRLALETGSPLVPVMGFGQNNVYTQLWNVPGSWYWRLQHWLAEKTSQYGVRLPLFCCYGFLGFLPWRTPVNVVVGSPIEVRKTADATEKEVDDLHSRYLEELLILFNTHRDKYGVPKETQIIFV